MQELAVLKETCKAAELSFTILYETDVLQNLQFAKWMVHFQCNMGGSNDPNAPTNQPLSKIASKDFISKIQFS